MADERLRELERTRNDSPAAEARYLAAAARYGQIPVERLELAAFLGDEPAMLALDGWGPALPRDHPSLRHVLALLPRNASGRMLVAAALAFPDGDPHDLIFAARHRFVAALAEWCDSNDRSDLREAMLASLAAFEAANRWREETHDFQPGNEEAVFLTNATLLALVAGRTLRAWLTAPVPEPDDEHSWTVRRAFEAAELLLYERLRGDPKREERLSLLDMDRFLLERTREWILSAYVPYVRVPGLHRRAYERAHTYAAEERLVHPTHGLGRVKKAGARSIVVRFADGVERTLVHTSR